MRKPRLPHRAIRLLAFLCCVTAGFAEIKFQLIDRDIVLKRLQSCPQKDLDRQEQLRAYFAEAGCAGPALTFDPDKHSRFGNVICTLAGSLSERIVVGAHFDHAEIGSGAVDNWSGAALLPSLYQALAAIPRQHTFVFIGFYGEERGLVGSRQYVHNVGKEGLTAIDAMVNLDTFVLGPTEIWAGHADPTLEKDAQAIASAMKLPLGSLKIENVSNGFRELPREADTQHRILRDHAVHVAPDALEGGSGFADQSRRLLQHLSSLVSLLSLSRSGDPEPHCFGEVTRCESRPIASGRP